MALSAAAPRQSLHTRTLTMQGFRREDGLFDIEGHLVDTKPVAIKNEDRGGEIAPGESLHEMHIRLTVDLMLEIKAAEAVTEWSPFSYCHGANRNFHKLVGLRIGPGWNRKVKEAIGGQAGCTHITEMLAQMATVAFQSIWGDKDKAMKDGGERPAILDTCHALASDSPVVLQHWPQFYSGDRSDEPA